MRCSNREVLNGVFAGKSWIWYPDQSNSTVKWISPFSSFRANPCSIKNLIRGWTSDLLVNIDGMIAAYCSKRVPITASLVPTIPGARLRIISRSLFKRTFYLGEKTLIDKGLEALYGRFRLVISFSLPSKFSIDFKTLMGGRLVSAKISIVEPSERPQFLRVYRYSGISPDSQ